MFSFRFRDLDMPVEHIKAILNAGDVDRRNALIVEHLRQMESTLESHATFDVRAVERVGDTLVVATLVSGTFLGSPLPIDHAFVVSSRKIRRLVIG
ncbi:MAG: hypothetical protein WB615_16400 [Candidatus Tumulicola sp.]